MKTGKLEHIFYLEEEIAGEQYLEAMIQEQSKLFYAIKSVPDMQNIKQSGLKAENWYKEADKSMLNLQKQSGEEFVRNSLVIAATDHTIQRAKELGFAVCAYANSNFPGQGLYGADVLIESFEEVDLSYLECVRRRHFGIPWDIAETRRCRIREICMDDMEALFALYAEPHMTDYMEPLYSWEEELLYEQAYIDNMYRFYEYGMWVVIEKSTGKLIGRAGVEHREYPAEEYRKYTGAWDMEKGIPKEQENIHGKANEKTVMELEMGYAIATSYQRKGYATEVCQAILSYAAEHLDYPRINCLIEKENTASIRLVEKLGFTCIGISMASGKTMLRYVKQNN